MVPHVAAKICRRLAAVVGCSAMLLVGGAAQPEPDGGPGEGGLIRNAELSSAPAFIEVEDGLKLVLPEETPRLAVLIARLTGVEPGPELATATAAANVLAYERGATAFRVHDVRQTADALRVAAATFAGDDA